MTDTPAIRDKINHLENQAAQEAEALGIPSARITKALGGSDYFDLISALLPLRTSGKKAEAEGLRKSVEELLRIKAFSFPPAVRKGRVEAVVFGTGGHRGEIGVGLTLAHIHVITQALMNRMEELNPEERLHHFGAESLEEIRKRGIVIGHDNRLFNPEFSYYTAHLLSEGGYKVGYAGTVASPEISRFVPLRGWAGAINFTPSHNPFRYGGIKFSPADGGLAGGDLTEPLAQEANRLLEAINPADWPGYDELSEIISRQAGTIQRVDIHTPYLESLQSHPVVRLDDLAEILKNLPPDKALHFVVDPVFGGAVPVYRMLQARLGDKVMTLLNTEEDPYFGGQTTEPNDQTLEDSLGVLKGNQAPFQVAIRNDPDGDRGLVGDAEGAVRMNRFAALVMRYLIDLGIEGDIVTTFPTSRYGMDFARKKGRGVHLTPVGFKNFRTLLLDNRAMVAYEESDGITISGHTLDKDGVLAGLLALRIVLHYGKSLNQLLKEIDAETGDYYYQQINFQVEITAAEVKEKLKKLTSVRPGDEMGGGENLRRVKNVNSEDGYMFEFDDGGWILMRPSGTEPKVRIYAESRISESETEALCELGKTLAREAIGN